MSSKAGWEGDIRVATTEGGLSGASDEAKIQSVRVNHGPNLKALFEMGSREPQEIKEGNIEISLTIEAEYVAGSQWPTRAGVGSTGAHTTYFVGVYPGGYGSGNPKIVLEGKFNNWNMDGPQDGVVSETVDFVGKAISVGTI